MLFLAGDVQTLCTDPIIDTRGGSSTTNVATLNWDTAHAIK